MQVCSYMNLLTVIILVMLLRLKEGKVLNTVIIKEKTNIVVHKI